MTRFATLLIGSALTFLIAGHGFAADAAPEASQPAAATAAPAPAASPLTTPPAGQPAAPAKELKIGYVTLSKIATQSAAGKGANEKLKAKSEKLRAKLEAKQKQLEKQKSAIEAKLGTMTPKERAAKGEEFQKKMEEFQKQVRSSELEVADFQEKLTGEMYKTIQKVATQYAKANGYALVTEERAVLYADDSLNPTDLTDEIIELLDKKPAK